MTVETALEHARRAFALKKYEQAVEHYATALELQSVPSSFLHALTSNALRTKKLQHDAPEMADLYFSYGKALLENAIAQASVLGKEPESGPEGEEEKRMFSRVLHCISPTPFSIGSRNGPILEFGDEGDGEDEDGAMDLLGESAKEPEEESDDEEEGEEGEPEDDFNAAWEVFELARGIYEKASDGDDIIKLKLADTYIALGDVSLETGAASLVLRTRWFMSVYRKV